ncbi:hypothetical protein [Chitinophaga sp. GbtcB8]|uniref:hypothetical protein n=1 Tax=Chitinophaga sp. GbtcB8 TaxID=2824753 RepID=UPI001C2FD3A1|nr:hypothetical protein [Chitinophaga sp. GbtcB8]
MYIFLIILVLLMPIPIYLGFRSLFADRHHQKVYQHVKDAFQSLIKRQGLSIAEVNMLGNRLIAMDRNMNKLIFVVYKNGITRENCLNPNEIISCKIEKKSSDVSGYIRKVNLELTFRRNGVITFSFFDEEVDDLCDLPSRIKKAQYWKRQIQYQISSVPLTNVNRETI